MPFYSTTSLTTKDSQASDAVLFSDLAQDVTSHSVSDSLLQQALLEKIRQKSAVVAVVGLGYVGLPLAICAAEEGFSVVGLDTSSEKVALIMAGQSYIDDIDNNTLKSVVASDLLVATTDASRLADADVVVICVPTPLTKNKTPDLSYIEEAANTIAQYLRPGQLITLESTTYPGTTEEILRKTFEKTDLTVGVDYFLAYSPERVDPGNSRFKTENTNKVLGATTPACLRVAEAFYRKFIVEVVSVSSTQTAEMVKIFENTFRSVNVALVNELALICDKMGLNVWEVVEAAGTKPFGMMSFYPGPGVGGHCIPIDPYYLAWKAREFDTPCRFVELAGEINDIMPQYVVDRMIHGLGRQGKPLYKANILLLGLAYKKDIADHRHSPALMLWERLATQGAQITYHDPLIPEFKDEHGVLHASAPLNEDTLAAADCVVIVTPHSCFDPLFIAQHSSLIMDTRNLCRSVVHQRDHILLL